jgi:allantoate deiminase
MGAHASDPPDVEALGRRAEAMIRELGGISADPDRMVRLFLSPEHRRAADMVARWMREAGLAVDEDVLGTVRGHAGQGPRLLIGSHIDSVIDAGLYDGTFGVIAGILAAGHVLRSGRALPFGIDVLAFGDEEGSRFPVTLNSSLACAGQFRPETLERADADGVTLAEALRRYGKDPAAIPTAAYRAQDVAGYVEVHIEQGPVLEAEGRALGVVTAIIGQTYLNVEIAGMAGHAGTVPMALRRDALACAAEIVLLGERLARETQGELVATVGRLAVEPGAPNVVPGRTALVFDIRSGDDALRARFVERLGAGCRAIAAARSLDLTIAPTREVATTLCDPAIQEGLAKAIADVEGREARRLWSGAGHDGQAMARLCPVGMLFVRCRGGISHNPAEHASPADMGLAVAALIRFVETFAPASAG